MAHRRSAIHGMLSHYGALSSHGWLTRSSPRGHSYSASASCMRGPATPSIAAASAITSSSTTALVTTTSSLVTTAATAASPTSTATTIAALSE